METRRILSTVLGALQSIIGIILAILVALLFFNIFEVRIFLNVTTEVLPLYLIFFGLFSIFSFINGFFLIRESQGIV
ncbi:MAG: hypothetical protein P8X91_09055 [Candidatus Bathyarchaeota archaeon]|jgi:hypothetical protein